MVKNGICFGGASKQNALFLEEVPLKNAPMSPIYRIGPVRMDFIRRMKLVLKKSKNKLKKFGEWEVQKQKIEIMFIFLLKIHSQKNQISTVKAIFCDLTRCYIGVYNFILLMSRTEIS